MIGAKRKHGDESPEWVYNNKVRNRPSAEARIDPTYGQRSAIPVDEDEYSDDEDGEISYNEEMDALAYLKSVRREADGIPNLLVAPKDTTSSNSRDIYEDGSGDFRGRYEDGAFYAAADSEIEEDSHKDDDLQLTYFDSILARYKVLREQLQRNPPAEAVQMLDRDHPVNVEYLNATKVKWWRWKLRTIDPVPAQIASMDKGSVLKLLTVLTGGSLLRGGSEIEIGVSRWAWSLLARLPERGQLNSEEIGVIRELGKKAVLVGIGLKADKAWEAGMRELEQEYDEDEVGGEVEAGPTFVENEDEIDLSVEKNLEIDGNRQIQVQPLLTTASRGSSSISESHKGSVPICDENEVNKSVTVEISNEASSIDPVDLIAAKEQMLEALNGHHQEPIEINIEPEIESPKQETPETEPRITSDRLNTKATVDMIVTVAGEIYGQRDLLEFRAQWSDL